MYEYIVHSRKQKWVSCPNLSSWVKSSHCNVRSTHYWVLNADDSFVSLGSYRTCCWVMMSKPRFARDEMCSAQEEMNSLGCRWVSAAWKDTFVPCVFSVILTFFSILSQCKCMIQLCFWCALMDATGGLMVLYQHSWQMFWQFEQIIEPCCCFLKIPQSRPDISNGITAGQMLPLPTADQGEGDIISKMIYWHFEHRSSVETSLSSSPTCFLPMESCDKQAAGKGRVLLWLMLVAKVGI